MTTRCARQSEATCAARAIPSSKPPPWTKRASFFASMASLLWSPTCPSARAALASMSRKTSPHLFPVLIITGLPASDDLRQHAEQSHKVLHKPFDSDHLTQAIGQILQ